MEKRDLVSGKHVVEIRYSGKMFLFIGDRFVSLKDFILAESIMPNLAHKIDERLDIVKIYEIKNCNSLELILTIKQGLKLIWERKPELSDVERVILMNIDKEYKYIARDKDEEIAIFKDRPIRVHDYWSAEYAANFTFTNLFKMVKWQNEHPTNISDLLNAID